MPEKGLFPVQIAEVAVAVITVVIATLCIIIVSRNRRELKAHDIWYKTLGSFEIAIIMLLAFSVYHAMRDFLGWQELPGDYPEYIFILLGYVFLARSSVQTKETAKYLEALHDRLRELSITDELTGLFNRRYFFYALGEEIRRAERYQLPLSLVMADIDQFKKVNDKYGHVVGDEVLKKITELMKDSFRRTDILARYGGEELVGIATVTSLEGATILAERFRERVFNHRFYAESAGETFTVAISLGVASPKAFPIDEKELLIEADKAMYEAKAQGGNKVRLAS